jgi:hypothetical protein
MAYTRLKPRSCVLDPANGLARGITFCVPFFEGGGNPADIVSKETPSIVAGGVGNPVWTQDLYGASLAFQYLAVHNADQISFANNPGFVLTGSFTVAIRAKAVAWDGSNTLFKSATYIDLTDNNFQGQGNNWISCQYYDGAGNIKRLGITAFPSTGIWHTFIITVVNNVPIDFYVDDTKKATSTSSAAGTRATTGSLDIGGGGTASTANAQWGFDGSIDFYVMWNRVLIPSEIYSFARDPHQIFAVPRPVLATSIATVSSGGGGLLMMGAGT